MSRIIAKTLQPPTDDSIPPHCDLMTAMIEGIHANCDNSEYAAATVMFPLAYVFCNRLGHKEGRDLLVKSLTEAINSYNQGEEE